MKSYYNPEDIYVIQNRKTKKYKILDVWTNYALKPVSIYEVALKVIPCRTELRFYKVYGQITFLDRLLK